MVLSNAFLFSVIALFIGDSIATLSCPAYHGKQPFNLASGEACLLCVPENYMETCRASCNCPDMQCSTHTCTASPNNCGMVVCESDAVVPSDERNSGGDVTTPAPDSPNKNDLVVTTQAPDSSSESNDLTCPENYHSKTMNLGEKKCLLCVSDTYMGKCGVNCTCPDKECSTRTCTISPENCGTVICEGDDTVSIVEENSGEDVTTTAPDSSTNNNDLTVTTESPISSNNSNDLTCPSSHTGNSKSFELPSGEACLLCVPATYTEECKAECKCSGTQCTWACSTKDSCGVVICENDGSLHTGPSRRLRGTKLGNKI